MPEAFDDIPLRELAARIAEAIAQVGEATTETAVGALSEMIGTVVPSTRKRLIARFTWSAVGRGMLEELPPDSGVFRRSTAELTSNDDFGNETFGSICEIVDIVDPEKTASFNDLANSVCEILVDRGCRDRRLVRATVGSAIWATGRRSK